MTRRRHLHAPTGHGGSDQRPPRVAQSDDGQILVLFAGGLVTLLLILGLVIDGGVAFVARRDAQNEADLAALTGTKVVLDHYIVTGNTLDAGDVETAVADSLEANRCTADSGQPCEGTSFFVAADGSDIGPVADYGAIPVGAQGVRVEVTKVVPTFIAGAALALFNGSSMNHWDVGAAGAALTGSYTAYFPGGPLLPIAIREPAGGFNIGQFYTLQSGHTAPGNFSWLDFDSVANPGPSNIGASVLGDFVCEPNSPPLTLPQPIEGKAGLNLSSESRGCIESYIAAGTTVMLPTYGPTAVVTEQGSSATYPISSVVAFVITGFDAGGSTGLTISGFFREVYSTGYVAGGATLGAPDPNATSWFIGLID